MRIRSVAWFLLSISLTVVFGSGQESGSVPGTPPNAAKPFQWSAELDGDATHNLNDPASGINGLRSFDTHSNSFRLAASTFDMDYKSDYLGAHLTAGYGDLFSAIASTDQLKGANSYLSRFYVSYRPLRETGLQVDVGKFYTSVGAEVVDTQLNYNYSRSLLFTLGEPYYHFGVRATIPITNAFSVGAQVLNGWNNVAASVGGATLELQLP